MKWIWETESSIIISTISTTGHNTNIDFRNRGHINVTQAINMIQTIDHFTISFLPNNKWSKVQRPLSDWCLKLVVAIGGRAPFLVQPWQIDIERPNHSRHAPKRASSVLIHKYDSCDKQIVKYLINRWHIFVFSWRVGIRFLTFKPDLVRNREVRSGELGINLNNVSSYTQPRLSHDGGKY